MKKSDKKILTWTRCCERAEFLRKHQPDAYKALMDDGTDRFLPGFHVSCENGLTFVVWRGHSRGFKSVEISGRLDESGVYWTVYRHNLTPTSYRKSFWDRHMPVSFPTGLPKRGAQGGAIYHAADGKTELGWVELSEHRGSSAKFSVQCDPGYLLVNDSTGKLVNMRSKPHAETIAASGRPLHCSTTDVVEYIEFHVHNEDTYFNFPFSRVVSLEETLGIYPGCVDTRTVWMKSILDHCAAGLMDKYKVLPLAARMWNAAYRFCQEHREKGARFIAYPMKQAPNNSESSTRGEPVPLRFSGGDMVDANGIQELVPNLSREVAQYHMPRIVIYFAGGRNRPRFTHPTRCPNSLQSPRNITMTLPPHGNDLLYPKDHYAALNGKAFTCRAEMRGQRDWTNPDHSTNMVTQSGASVVKCLRRAYHCLPIVKPGVEDWGYLHQCGVGRWGAGVRSWAESQAASDASADRWDEREDCVHVTSDFDEPVIANAFSRDREPGIWSVACGQGVGFAATPESAVNMVTESSLIDSLPLS